jgi:hypothetical protein
MMLPVRVPARCHAAQAVGGAEPSKDQRHQMIPALERLVVGITVVTSHNRVKPAPVDGFKKLAENARCEAHAPSIF